MSFSGDEIEEVKAYVEGVLGGKIIQENMGICKGCGKHEDLRQGYCFECVFPRCPFPKGECEGKRLVFNSKRQRVWVDLTFVTDNKIFCDRDAGLCAKAKNFLN